MKVFVAGASGAMGRPLVRQLVAAGHEVTGMTRREERAAEIRGAGASAVICDVFDAAALESAVVEGRARGRRPPADLAAAAGSTTKPRTTRWPRRTGCAARAPATSSRRRRRPAPAASLPRASPSSTRPKATGSRTRRRPCSTALRRPFGGAVEALADLERQVTGAEGIEGVVLRYGWLYGPGTYFDREGSQTEEALKRRLPIVGKGTGTFSFLQVEDAAAATVAAVEQRRARHLQRGRRRAGADARVGAGLRRGRRRQAPAPGAGLARPPGRRLRRRRIGDSSCAAPPTPRPSASSAGSRATRAGARASATPKRAASARA